MYSINNLTAKIAQAINSGLLGILLSACGFDAALSVQSASTITGLNIMRYLYPIIPFAGAIIFALIYPLKGKMLEDVRAAIAEKKN